MMKSSRLSVVVVLALATSGCLKTRSDVKEVDQRQVLQQQVSTLQRDNADVGGKFGEYDEQMRDLRGRLEVVESKVTRNDSNNDKGQKSLAEKNQDLDRRLTLIQESVSRMDAQMQALGAEILALKAEQSARGARESTASSGKKDAFDDGLEHFERKDWKKAILAFNRYRETSPKGKRFPESTYLIGVAFQELGLRDDARTFYDEVIAKFPNSNEAKKARVRMKSLKK